jgi:hypothetical protein
VQVTSAWISATARGVLDEVVNAGSDPPAADDDVHEMLYSTPMVVVNVRPFDAIALESTYVYEHSPGTAGSYPADAPGALHET